MTWLTEGFCSSWENGSFVSSYDTLGCHLVEGGAWFAVWAPHAEYVAVIGDFNGWDAGSAPMERKDPGIWQCFIPGVEAGSRYKYHIARGAYRVDKTDPYAFSMEPPVANGSHVEGLSSIVTDLSYSWNDGDWMASRLGPRGTMEPVSVYEVHLGSWRKRPDGYSYSYREIAEPLADHVLKLGFTHIELMPIMEHPFYGSWGYQIVGYYAPTQRYGSPQDLMYFVDYMHQRGIGVILDWVPAHFATDQQGLTYFDGSTLYEYDDPQMRFHPDWGTYVFDYNKPGVRNFLISNAHFWLDYYHFDGLRFDAVASMLYRDYSRDNWTPNMYGGRENLEAIDLLKRVNESVYQRFGEVMMIAEESTAWPGVSKPTYENGLGFLYKWNMGWMHDSLEYISKEPVHRQYHHNDLTFPLVYAFSEQFMLPLSHDEVVHGKGSLWEKMPGDIWQKAANLRLLYGHMFGHPGKKLLFMGSEFGQTTEWNHNESIPWDQSGFDAHAGIEKWITDLNGLYRNRLALWKDAYETFHWIDYHDHQQSVVSYWRENGDEIIVFVINFTPVPREGYRIGMPRSGSWELLLNSDAAEYGGSGVGTFETIETEDTPCHGQSSSIEVLVPPLGMLIMTHTE